MKIPFVKSHGAKNDFLLTWAADARQVADLPTMAVAICDRYTGVGGDGWMLVDPQPGEGYDGSIRLFNSDGSEPELSGNGTRCAAALLIRENPSLREIGIRTGAGIKRLAMQGRRGNIYDLEMNMGQARVVNLNGRVQGRDAVIVDVGNPQCALPVPDFDFDWRATGKGIEWDAAFPKRTNVSFVRKIDRNTIEVRFWERGAGETNSSGTGSTGAAAAAIGRSLVESPVTVITPAGPLSIRSSENSFYLAGPAELVAEGVFYATNDSGK